ncbi:MAG: export transporter periplasmic protein LptC [Pseudomonadota bacterium]|jgi:LPS export ABC transporter protein LptC
MFKLRYSPSRLFNFLTVIILSGLCVLLNSLTQINFQKFDLPKNKPEFSATGFKASLYSTQGNLLYALSAESGIEYPDSTKINLTKLKLQIFNQVNSQLEQQLTSDNGWVDSKTHLGFLGDNVVLTAIESRPQDNILVYAQNVALNAKTRQASSSAPVKAIRNQSILTGQGFQLDYEKKLLTIESKVKVIYVK